MSAGLKPYPAYGDSGTEWLGEIPAHWSARQLVRLGEFFKGNGGTKGDEIPEGVPCIRYGDIYTQHQFFTQASRSFVSAERASDYTPIRYGDILFAASGETIEEIGKSIVSLIRPRACCGGDVIVFRPSIEVDAKFMGYATDCRRAAFQKSRMGRGITVMHLYRDQLKYMWIALPPLAEQATIAHYLNRETEKVDALVAEKQRLIDLLQEKRTALISHAVTKGLDRDVPMKDSGIEWLGNIPAHWDLSELKRLVPPDAPITYGIVQAGPDIEGGVPYLRTSDMSGDSFSRDGYLRTSHEIAHAYRRSEVQAGDIVVAIRATVGKALVAPEFLSGANLTQGTARVRPGGRVTRGFLLNALTSQRVRQRWAAIAKGATFREITLDMLRRLTIPVPPLLEQKRIESVLTDDNSSLSDVLAKTDDAVRLLVEYRSALITAAVTGQIDVRTYRQEAS